MERLVNTIARYAWGTTSTIPDLLGQTPDGRPAAELWMGAHRSAPSLLADGRTLGELISTDPIRFLGSAAIASFGEELPFLFKVLSAARALSIQVHPSKLQAERGFARENDLGLALDAPDRSYRDANHKPELICALTPFEALCGFRGIGESADLVASLRVRSLRPTVQALRHGDLAGAVADALHSGPVDTDEIAAATDGSMPWIAELARTYPGDPGVIVALLLHHVLLAPGQALALGAGTVHAYLGGTGIELMANSDNIVRGGLTPKHVDVDELWNIGHFDPAPVPILQPDPTGRYVTDFAEFELRRLDAGRVRGPAIALCLEGHLRIGSELITRGESVFIGHDEDAPVRADGVAYAAIVP